MPEVDNPRRERDAMRDGPLRGIRVLEFSQIVAGPLAGMMLSDLGAEVVKVEPLSGEARRNSGAVVPNEGKFFQSLNRGKRSLTVDLQQGAGRALIHRLVSEFDVVIINYRVGVAKRLGIDYERLSLARPDLIYANISGFGGNGPHAERAGSDIVAQAYSGLMAAEGKVDAFGAPAPLTATAVIDRSAGFVAAMGICAAIVERERTGHGQELHVSLLQTALELISNQVMREPVHDSTVRDPLFKKIQEGRASGQPYDELIRLRQAGAQRFASHRLFYGSYETKSGALVIGALTRENRERLRQLLGVRDATDELDFDSGAADAEERINAWRGEIQHRLYDRTADEWVELCSEVGVPASVVHFPEEMADDPQVRAAGMTVELTHTVTGPQRVVAPLVKFSRTNAMASSAAPALAADSRAVLTEAGFSDAEIELLLRSKVITTRD